MDGSPPKLFSTGYRLLTTGYFEHPERL